jgi:hypothetical protein
MLDRGAAGKHRRPRSRVSDRVDHCAQPHGLCLAADRLDLLIAHALIAARA